MACREYLNSIPGAAWNEAERRAIPLGLLGFFFAGAIDVFSHDPAIQDPFLAGFCGAVGFFIGGMGFFIGLHHKKLALALISGFLLIFLPSAITALSLPVTGKGRGAFIPSLAIGAGVYVILHLVHQRLSGTILVTYVRQLAEDQHGVPTTRWARRAVWVLAGLGAAILFLLLLKR